MNRALIAAIAATTGCGYIIGFEDQNALELASLDVSRGTISPAFDPAIDVYEVALPYVGAEIAITAAAPDPSISIELAGESLANDVPRSLAVPVGDTGVAITLRTTSGVERTYTIAIRRADLDIAFAAPRSVFGFGMMYDVRTADVDDNGIDDLAYQSFDGRIGTLVNDGTGVFTSAAWLQNTNARAFAVADVTGDRRNDMIVSNGTLLVAEGNGDGTYQDPVGRGFAESGALAAGRVDTDDIADVVVANGSGLVTPLWGALMTLGPDWQIAPWSGDPRVVRIAQIDGAGGNEVVALDTGGRTVTVATVADPIILSPFQLEAGANPTDMVTADFDGDGRGDIAVLDSFAGKLQILTKFPNWTRTVITIPGFPRSLATGDLDDDGHVDLVMTAGENLVVLRNDGTGAFEQRTFADVAETPGNVAIGDFDHDGRDDVVLSQGTSELVLLLGVKR